MKKFFAVILTVIIGVSAFAFSASAASHTVVKGDSMWKIAVKYQVGLDEIISANPQIKNPAMIYPGQVLTIPQLDSSVSDFESEVIRLTNEQRKQAGLSPLTADWELSRVARFKSQDMRERGYFSHTSPTYGSPFEMMKAFGLSYKTAGENIARGQRTPQEVVNAWMNSSGHRANILNSSFKRIGVGYDPNGNYWTQMFIG
ncbi:MAG: SafA/ExsA family spore coat assembly protein [Clostridia bacterium]|nr:SafA/ExsA family spore coat assembly protein [Clostridia bacterium]